LLNSIIIEILSPDVATGKTIFTSPVTPLDFGLVIPPKELKSKSVCPVDKAIA
jgi:hypothetical protein